MSIFGVWQKFFLGIGFHAVGGGRWIVKWRLDGDEMETMRGTDRSIGPPEHQASDVRNTKKNFRKKPRTVWEEIQQIQEKKHEL